jgi:hypothetical protein
MKKIFTAIFLFFGIITASAQCVPDLTITQPGVYPDAATGLPHGIVNQPYSAVIQFRVPTDTTYMSLPATIDSINVTNVTGMPAGFTYSCTPSSCSFHGGSNGCLLIDGPAQTSTGTYPIVVDMIVYGNVFGSPQVLPQTNSNYSIVIDQSIGINNISSLSFSVSQNKPNPVKGYTEIGITMPRAGNASVKISNLLGEQVFNKQYILQKGNVNIQLNLNDLQPGIYLYTVSNGINSVTRRMILSND